MRGVSAAGRLAELLLKLPRHVYLMARMPHYCLNLLLWVWFTSLHPLAALSGRSAEVQEFSLSQLSSPQKLVRRCLTCGYWQQFVALALLTT